MNPIEFFASLGMGDHIAGVLSWVAFAISAAVGLTFALLGIRKGLAWFMAIVEERRAMGLDGLDADVDRQAVGLFLAWESATGGGSYGDFEGAVYGQMMAAGADEGTARGDAADARRRVMETRYREGW